PPDPNGVTRRHHILQGQPTRRCHATRTPRPGERKTSNNSVSVKGDESAGSFFQTRGSAIGPCVRAAGDGPKTRDRGAIVCNRLETYRMATSRVRALRDLRPCCFGRRGGTVRSYRPGASPNIREST